MNDIFQNEIKIQQRIKNAFEKSGKTSQIAQDIAFHMTDWMSDLDDLMKTYSNIENLDDKEITSFIYKFLSHVPNHLNAAMKLGGIGKVEDVFKVNIFEDNYE